MSLSDEGINDIKGTCGVCKLEFKINLSSGLLRKHVVGSKAHKKQCAGSYSMPINPVIRPHAPPSQSVFDDIDTTSIMPSHLSELAELNGLFNGSHKFRALRFIPHAARPACRLLLTNLLWDIIDDPSAIGKWCSLLKFPFIVLKSAERGGRKHNLTKIIHKRISNYNAPIIFDIENALTRANPNNSKALASAVTRKIECGNLRAAVRLISQDDTLAQPSAETLLALRAIHPLRISNHTDHLAKPDLNLQISSRQIAEQIRSFTKGSSAGPDLLSPQHMQDLISGPNECSEFLNALSGFINILLSGNCPYEISKFLCGAKLIALKKGNGKIRPIAIGCAYRRLAAKCANNLALTTLKDRFGALQLGIGCKSGAEAAIHAARNVLSNLTNNECIVKLDISNAFNSIKRDSILEAVHTHLPLLFNFVKLCYDKESFLFFNGDIIESSEGVQQGDPLGCTLFSLAIHPVIENIKSNFKVAYVDDITMADDLSIVENDVIKFELGIQKLGLSLNYSKSEIISRFQIKPSSFLLNFTKIDFEECMLLGAPLIKGSGLNNILQSKVDDLSRLSKRLTLISSHDALIVLKNVMSLPKLNFLLRCSPCFGNQILLNFDSLLRETLTLSLNIELGESAWNQASLPVKVGGLGIRCTSDLAPSAFLASNHASYELSELLYPIGIFNNLYFDAFNHWFKDYSIMHYPLNPTKQKCWDIPCVKTKLATAFDSASTPSDKARLLALQSPKSSSWLEAWPITSCGLRLTDEEIRISVGLRLGAPICTPHDCKLCGASVDSKGTHGLSCRRSAGRHIRHSMLNDIIARSLAKINIPSMREPNLNLDDDSRVDGCSLVPWQNGRALAWDATVADTLAVSYLSSTSVKAGIAADRAAIAKIEKYKALPNSYIFIPLSFETMGPIHTDSLNFLKTLASKLSVFSSDIREISYFYQRISMAIQKGNAISILGSTHGLLNNDIVH